MKNFKFTINGNVYEVAVETAENGKSNVTVNGKSYVVETEAQAAQPTVRRAAVAGASAKSVSGVMKSPLPGKVLKVLVSAGQAVKRGETLMVIESMKMENNIPAPRDGKVTAVHVAAGNSVMQGDALIDIE